MKFIVRTIVALAMLINMGVAKTIEIGGSATFVDPIINKYKDEINKDLKGSGVTVVGKMQNVGLGLKDLFDGTLTLSSISSDFEVLKKAQH